MKVKLRKGERLECIEPWSAAGPGWANAGVTLHLTGHYRKVKGVLREGRRTLTLYRVGTRDTIGMGPQAQVLFPVVLAAYGALLAAIQRESIEAEP